MLSSATQSRPSHRFPLPAEFGWLLRQIRPLWRWHLASFLCITAGSLLALLTPLVLRWLIDGIIPHNKLGLLAIAVALIFIGYQGRIALTTLGSYLMLNAAQKLGLRLRFDLLRHLDTLSADYYDETPVGTIMYPFREPIEEISYFGSDLLPAMLRMLLTTAFTLATMFALSAMLTLAMLPLIPVFLGARHYFRTRLAADADRMQEDREAWSNFLAEHLSSVIPVQLLGQEKRQERKAFRLLGLSVRSQQRLYRTGSWFTASSSLAVVAAMCAVIGYGGKSVLGGTLSTGSLVAFYGFVTQLFDPLSGASELYARAQKTFASIRQLEAAFGLRPAIFDRPGALAFGKDQKLDIEFANVRFGYARQKEMLHIPSLRIAPGEQLAIAGENGAGKSTLAKLIARLYDPVCGSIRFSGEDLRKLQLRSVRQTASYLPRDPVLFDGTIESNLLFVCPGASEQELEAAIRTAGLSALVASLPLGMRQRIGPDGCQLSGGERQRLALARAILQQPRVLILDEATSCLDPAAEAMILGELRAGNSWTLIVISHRHSTLSMFPRIVVLEAGFIVQDGNGFRITDESIENRTPNV